MICITKSIQKGGLVTKPKLQFQPWYSAPGNAIRGQSYRVVLDGGLSPLRFDGGKKEGTISLALANSGAAVKTNVSEATAKRNFFKNLPQKSFLSNFVRPTVYNSNQRAFSTSAALPLSSKSFSSNGNGADDAHGMGKEPILTRDQISKAELVLIKMGSAVITREDGHGLALGRLASIIEQVAELQNANKHCILITSGAVAFGKQRLAQEIMLSMSMRDTIQSNTKEKEEINIISNSLKKPNAAVGQSGLQALYETMFRNYGIIVAQVLVTTPDFYNDHTRAHLLQTIEELIKLNIIPIINTNDAISALPVTDAIMSRGGRLPITDNDSLAANLAVATKADLCILMSDVTGIYDKPPKEGDARVLHTFNPEDKEKVEFGEKSNTGTGGMESKVDSALWALERGVPSVICNGMGHNTLRKIMQGRREGTFFTTADTDVMPVEVLAKNARSGSRNLQALTPADRANIIHTLADQLVEKSAKIMEANQKDLVKARSQGIEGPLYDRLVMTPGKLSSLAEGLKQIAESSFDNLGRIVRRTKISETMSIVQKTVSIGVLLVIFESRPDCLPQIASLSIASGNGLLMKGGSEAEHTNNELMMIVKSALSMHSCANAISLVNSREAIGDLLKLDSMVDLVIPRGSNELVKSIKEQSKMIPVLGHAEGICHVYVDKTFKDMNDCLEIIRDSKTDYPAACNAMETLLIHSDLVKTDRFHNIIQMFKSEGVNVFSGPKLADYLTFGPPIAPSMKIEYSDRACTIEMVDSVTEAVNHINTFGSSHTDVIISDNEANIQYFLDSTDSACTFANCSSRMADGFRLGLGAEVGISTGRIHARGPVGVEGLLTTKWVAVGDADTAEAYASGRRKFLHEQLPLYDSNGQQQQQQQRDVEYAE